MRKRRRNGDGSIYFDEKFNCYRASFQVNKKRYTLKQKKNETTEDFEKRCRKVRSQIDEGTLIQKDNSTIQNIALKYIEQKKKDGLISLRTYKRDMETLNALVRVMGDYATMPIIKITPEDIESVKENFRVYSNNSISKMWVLLTRVFHIAYARKKIFFDVMQADIRKPISMKANKQIEALSKEQESNLRDILENAYGNTYSDIILFQLETGMRIGEVLARKITDVDFKNRTIKVDTTLTQDDNYQVMLGEHTKTYKKTTGVDKGVRTIPLSPLALEIIIRNTKLSNIQGLIFWDYEANYYVRPHAVNNWLKRVNYKYHISEASLSSHVMRHTYITRLQEKNIALPVVQYLAGHVQGSNMTNDVYTTVSQDFIKQELARKN